MKPRWDNIAALILVPAALGFMMVAHGTGRPCEAAAAVKVNPIVFSECEAPEPEPVYYNIPLSVELQDYTKYVCEQYSVPVELALAVMYAESSYQTDAVNGQSVGLMQIHKINFDRLSNTLDITDFMDPRSNILAGVYILAELMGKYDDTHKVLMAYNCGEKGAGRLWERGTGATAYSNKVIDYMEGLDAKETTILR